MTTLTPAQLSMRGRLGAYASWARTEDPVARTAPARRAAEARFDKLVDPDNVLPAAERARRAEAARKAHYTRMAMKSAQVRSSGRRAGAAAA